MQSTRQLCKISNFCRCDQISASKKKHKIQLGIADILDTRQQVCVLVRKVTELLDVGPKLIYECVPAFFVGHILKRCITQIIRVCTSLLNLPLPTQMPLDRVPHSFSHCDGGVAEFPVVVDEGFQFISEARRKMLGDDTMLIGKDSVCETASPHSLTRI